MSGVYRSGMADWEKLELAYAEVAELREKVERLEERCETYRAEREAERDAKDALQKRLNGMAAGRDDAVQEKDRTLVLWGVALDTARRDERLRCARVARQCGAEGARISDAILEGQ